MRFPAKFLLILLIISLRNFTPCMAQEYNVWKFSKKTLDFNNEPPSFYSDRNEETNLFHSSISDRQGKLILFTGYDSSIILMDSSGIQTDHIGYFGRIPNLTSRYKCAILKLNDTLFCLVYGASTFFPGHPQYFNEYVNYIKDSVGLYISLIGISSINGKPSFINGKKDLRINSLKIGDIIFHQNNDLSWWIVTEVNDKLYAYKIDKNASISPPVISNLNELEINVDSTIFNPRSSTMRFSHDGKLLLKFSYWTNKSQSVSQSAIYAYTFNENNGLFSNQILIEKNIVNHQFNFDCSDFVFSPNDSLFYIVFGNHPENKHLEQYQRFAQDIKASSYPINTQRYVQYAELGQNSKIYLSIGDGDYSLIYYPNKVGEECKFLLNAVDINCNLSVSGNRCSEGDFPFSKFHNIRMNFSHNITCDSTLELFNLADTNKLSMFNWYIYGPNNFLDSSNENHPKIKLIYEGDYWIKFKGKTSTNYQPWFSDSISVKFPEVPKANFKLNITKSCMFQNVHLFDQSSTNSVNANSGQFWLWDMGDGSKIKLDTGTKGDLIYQYNKSGNFNISLIYSNGFCFDTFKSNLPIEITDAPRPGLISDRSNGCAPLIVNFNQKHYDPIDSTSILLNNLPLFSNNTFLKDFNFTFTQPGTYTVTQKLFGSTGCVSVDSLLIRVYKGFDSTHQSELYYASLNEEKEIEIKWKNIDLAVQYSVFKKSNNTNWNRIFSGLDTSFIDKPINANSIYHYKIIAFDICDNTLTSNSGNNIVLRGINQNNDYAELSWNPYENWKNGVLNYQLFKVDPISLNKQLISTSLNLKQQDQGFFENSKDSVCYQIVAESNGTPTWISQSNLICLKKLPIVWIPNSFTPDNNLINPIFIPTLVGINDNDYQLIIYNRWGSIIFKTNSKNQGWDGNFQSIPAPIGVYYYHLSFSYYNEKGIIIKEIKNGTIQLLR